MIKLKVRFGLIDEKYVSWWNDVYSFPKLINYLGRNFEWVMYDQDKTGQVDYILIFSELGEHDPCYMSFAPTWNDLFGEKNGCECGSKYDRHSPNGHFMYCKLWSKF